jgi:hypothetical protein
MKTSLKKLEKAVELSVIDLKSQGKETVTLFDVLRNSRDFWGRV